MLIPTATDLENIFQVANLSVLPFWGLMVLLPNWSVTRR
ncbi:MAG: abscisic acid-deficient protein Aba4 family protein, partial [Cyanobacteria bacterium P01_D01_bin.6]